MASPDRLSLPPDSRSQLSLPPPSQVAELKARHQQEVEQFQSNFDELTATFSRFRERAAAALPQDGKAGALPAAAAAAPPKPMGVACASVGGKAAAVQVHIDAKVGGSSKGSQKHDRGAERGAGGLTVGSQVTASQREAALLKGAGSRKAIAAHKDAPARGAAAATVTATAAAGPARFGKEN